MIGVVFIPQKVYYFVHLAFHCAQGIHCPTLGSLLNCGGVWHVLVLWRSFEHKLLLGSIPILSSYLFIICLYVIEIMLFLIPCTYIYIYGSAVYIYICIIFQEIVLLNTPFCGVNFMVFELFVKHLIMILYLFAQMLFVLTTNKLCKAAVVAKSRMQDS